MPRYSYGGQALIEGVMMRGAHTWGVAVDATIVDDKGNEALMPTDFAVSATAITAMTPA